VRIVILFQPFPWFQRVRPILPAKTLERQTKIIGAHRRNVNARPVDPRVS
jgi:hypothetical protein